VVVAKHKSASVSHRRQKPPDDERVRRTRANLDAAFVALLHRRAYGDIRVSDITKKAGIGRATFYAHYQAKDDLLRSQFNRIVAPMLVVSPADPAVIEATALLNHVRGATRLYLSLMGIEGGNAPRILRECFAERVHHLLPSIGSPRQNKLTTLTSPRFIAATLVTVIECWLQQGAKESPQQVQTLFSDLVRPVLQTARG
jgi:AcrR family transcriptional regulator